MGEVGGESGGMGGDYSKNASDKTLNLKLWQKSKTQIVTTLKNSVYDKTKKNQIVAKLKNTNCKKTKKN